MKFKAKDKVVFEADYIPNNQVMTITRGTHKSHGIDQVRLLLKGGEGIALASDLRLATDEEIKANKRIIKVKYETQFGIPVTSDRKAGSMVDLGTSITIGIDLAEGPDWSAPVSINGDDNA
ncbi:hypothetical protein MCL36_09235 [Acinetobacter pittii]|uniref:hypothetical protein n=1 Tax=Acinetobacter pittii TaxID=48296 RepID=UPI001EFDC806|nr:hypothetical protein [Acinetobacter pittii]MCG9492712.1 hypothetical protein [Acinetobacter pittii]